MEKLILLARSNFKKSRGTVFGLFMLMMLSAMLIGVSLLMFIDAYPLATKEADRLDAGDGYIWISNDTAGIDEEYTKELLGDDAERFYYYTCLGYSNVSLPFGNGSVAPQLALNDRRAFEKTMDRTEIVTEDESIESPYIYLPYQFFTSGGKKIGDSYSFELMGRKYEFTVKGFTTNTYFGCNNTGSYEFVIDDESFREIYEKDSESSDLVLISYKLKDNVNAGHFKITTLKKIFSTNPAAVAEIQTLPSAISNRSFMALILAVSFLTVTIILMLVITLMLSNTVSNYIRENMKTIGALKAIGYTSIDIRRSIYFMFAFLATISSLIGAGLSYALMPIMSMIVVGQMGIPYHVSFNPVCSMIPVVFVILFVIMVSTGATGKIRKVEPIVALRDGVENHSFKRNHVKLDTSVFNVNVSLAMKTLFTNIRQNIITFFVTGLLMFICVVGLLMYENFNRNPKLGILTFEVCGGVAAVDYSVRDEAFKYLEDRSDVSNIRDLINITLTYNDEESLRTYVFDDMSKMNNKQVCYKGRLPEYDNEIAVSGKFASSVGIKVGDEVRFDYGSESYDYLVTGLIQTCNNAGREATMTREGIEHLLDLTYSPAYYWFDCDGAEASAKILDDISEEFGDHIISTMNFYEMLDGNMTTFKGISTVMLILVCVISAVVIVLILYLLIKAFIRNKKRDYGIYKALGYTSGNLIFQTALSFMPSIVLSAVCFSFLSYFGANPYLGMIMRSFGLMKCDFDIPVSGVIIIGFGLVIIAFVFSVIRAGMIRKIEPYNMLIRE